MGNEAHQLALPAGYRLDKYELDEPLGSGGFGITYLARDLDLNRAVAIKELLPTCMVTRKGTRVITNHSSENRQWEWAQKRFREEAEALVLCDHPNVLKVYCTFPANGTVYMVTRYEEGCVMETWLRGIRDEGHSITEADLRSILIPTLSALDRVHQAGFLHRDIKTENIYRTRDGRTVLLDFGNARQMICGKTMPVTTILTPGYAPYEQYGNVIRQGAWTDLYALGAVMYRSITNTIPPHATDRAGPGARDECLQLANSYAGRYSHALLASIDAALSVNPQARPQSAAAWKQALENDPGPLNGPPAPPMEAYHPPRVATRKDAPPDRNVIRKEVPRPKLPAPPRQVSRTPDIPVAPHRGFDSQGVVEIDKETARQGGRVTVNIEGRKFSISVPASTIAGRIICVPGMGRPGQQGVPAGNAYIRIQVAAFRQKQPHNLKSHSLALLSLVFPGLGNLPRAPLVLCMLYLLTTGGGYVLAYGWWSSDLRAAAVGAVAIALLLHLASVIAALRQNPRENSLQFLPRTTSGWWLLGILSLIFIGEIVAFHFLTSPEGLPSMQ